ncbi:MAG TPA: TAT-variant-translocated molybdopterin oxidoreductase [bacterium]|jgi:molybdopterin-containing oxidoreductase family iron-sulfur binding subunit
MPSEEIKRYWKSLDERAAQENGPAEIERELQFDLDQAPLRHPRRDFLKLSGFAFSSALLIGCQSAPIIKAIPFLNKPEEITPGKSYFYASTCGACSAGCGLMVKNRDGRPIKLEGNPQHPLSKGGLCAVGQASILGLYDTHRLKQPMRAGQPAAWNEVDQEIQAKLSEIAARGGAVRFLTGTITSPTMKWMIDRFLSRFQYARHIVYDPLTCSALLDAQERTFGVRALPSYHFDKADVIVSLDADFLGTWISPVEFTSQYASGRSLEGHPPRLSYHVQFESRLSLTGAKADQRYCIAPQDLNAIMNGLASLLARKRGIPFPGTTTLPSSIPAHDLDQLAEHLWQARGSSLVVSGSQDVKTQILCCFINEILGNYGSTLDLARPSSQRQGDDGELQQFIQELLNGKVQALFIAGANPVYDLPQGEDLAKAISKVPLVVNFASELDETANASTFVCPDHHYLESWSDAEAISGIISTMQPAIRPMWDTRAIIEILAVWMGESKSAHDIMLESWQRNIYPRRLKAADFQTFWDRAVHDGFANVEPAAMTPKPLDISAVKPATESPSPTSNNLALVLYPKVGMLDGRHANNPWLHELPDPISKVTWDNYACLSPRTAVQLGVSDGDVVRLSPLSGANCTIELPALVQPGQHDQVVAVALGYGRNSSARFKEIGPRWFQARPSTGNDGLVGKNAVPFLYFDGDARRFDGQAVSISPTGRRSELASTQSHHSIAVPEKLAPFGEKQRRIVQETTLPAFIRDPKSGGHPHHPPEGELWPDDHPYKGYRWGLVIDLNACTGCGACVIACQAENNVPVVGRDEVFRKREMHWIRIDRYYSDSQSGVDVLFQPMLCQQCGHAPCETVCPVLATVHSEEGLSQQVYNRCIGTRYCANNCPYKVRRFNWFNYQHKDPVQNLVLNPDVVVRSRGVMEKCTFCVQRIQEAKIEAKRLGQKVPDGAIQPACQQSCPAKAITFGDMNNPDSLVAKRMADPRNYRVLEELNVQPVIGYLTLVRNRQGGSGGKHHG